jgi:hypothetical protein
MRKPAYQFSAKDISSAEAFVAGRIGRPMATPTGGALGVFLLTSIAAAVAFSFADSNLSAYRAESISGYIGFGFGALVYLYLKREHRIFDAAVESELHISQYEKE